MCDRGKQRAVTEREHAVSAAKSLTSVELTLTHTNTERERERDSTQACDVARGGEILPPLHASNALLCSLQRSQHLTQTNNQPFLLWLSLLLLSLLLTLSLLSLLPYLTYVIIIITQEKNSDKLFYLSPINWILYYISFMVTSRGNRNYYQFFFYY